MNTLFSRAAASILVGLISASAAFAQTATTVPVGFMTYNITAGTGSARVVSSFSVPISDTATIAGASAGVISSLTATTLTSTGAGWTDNFATAASPYAVRITSGTAAGTFVSISTNTSTTLTLAAGTDLVALGVVAGTDRFEIVPVDTLNTLFGATGLIGGTSNLTADLVYLGTATQTAYYYNTTLSRWVTSTGPTTDRGNILIPFNACIRVARIATQASSITVTGTVPATQYKAPINNGGYTYTNNGFPVDVNLGNLAIHTKIPGWVSSTTVTTADTISSPSGAGWINYYHNQTNWVQTTGPTTNRNSVLIPAGTPILITKRGSASGTTVFTNPLPYSL